MKTPDHRNSQDSDDDRVWELLSQVGEIKPSPFFSRNVMREIRQIAADEAEAKAKGGILGWFRRPGVLLGGAVAGLALLAVIFGSSGFGTGSALPPVAESHESGVEVFQPSKELADVDYLGELMAVSDPAMLSDQAFADLF